MVEDKLITEEGEMSVCNPKECAVYEYVLDTLNRFNTMTDKLADGQQQLQLNMVKLTENLEGVKRLHERVDKSEERLTSLEKSMYKAAGAVAMFSLTVPMLVSLFLHGNLSNIRQKKKGHPRNNPWMAFRFLTFSLRRSIHLQSRTDNHRTNSLVSSDRSLVLTGR